MFPYVGYAFEAGITKGVAGDAFGSEQPIYANEYLTFLLRALGYSDAESDFYYVTSPVLAAKKGIYPNSAQSNEFTRGDMVEISYAALAATPKYSSKTLAEKLIEQGAFTAGKFAAVYDKAAFADDRAIAKAIDGAVEKNEKGELEKNSFFVQSHIVLNREQADGRLIVSALVGAETVGIGQDSVVTNAVCNVALARLELEKQADGSYIALSYRTETQPGEGSEGTESIFSPEVRGQADNYSGAMFSTCALATAEKIAKGEVTYILPTHDELVEKLLSEEYATLLKRIEAPKYGTILLRMTTAGAHGSSPQLCMVTNAASPLGEGRAVAMPLPRATGWLSAEPDTIELSADGAKLLYSVSFNDSIVIDKGLASEFTVHEKGVYSYTADLATGETDLKILPLAQ